MIPLTALAGAAWLGVLTSLSPCPLAGNIAAVTLLSRSAGRRWQAPLCGLLYTAGRSAAYLLVAAGVLTGLARSPWVSQMLQTHLNEALGPVLILAGLWMLGWIGGSVSVALAGMGVTSRAQRSPVLWAPLLGFLLALSFCPAPAALFFGGLLPLAQATGSPVILPLVYAVGTALPVLVFVVGVLAAGAWVNRATGALGRWEPRLRQATGWVFVAVGVYYCLVYVYALPL